LFFSGLTQRSYFWYEILSHSSRSSGTCRPDTTTRA
jgi:hypothetical protein